MKPIAAVVTHNRLTLLKECIARIRAQTHPVDILVIDNASDDGTADWLAEQEGLTYVRQRNLGGAAGFHLAIKAAYTLGYDLVWCMDDDTLPDPDTLEELVAVFEAETDLTFEGRKIGWVCSAVRWTDGSPAAMNQPTWELRGGDTIRERAGVLPAESCSFVSVCVSREAIGKVGLPIRDMFIWYDDVEFTSRVTSAGFVGLYAPRSTALHKTPENDTRGVGAIDRRNRWKHHYGLRNLATVLRTQTRMSDHTFRYLFLRRVWWTTVTLARNSKKRWIGYAWWWLAIGLFDRRQPIPADGPWDQIVRDLL